MRTKAIQTVDKVVFKPVSWCDADCLHTPHRARDPCLFFITPAAFEACSPIDIAVANASRRVVPYHLSSANARSPGRRGILRRFHLLHEVLEEK